MSQLVIEDRSSAGHVLGGVTVEELPGAVSLAELLEIRIRAEVEDYNADPGEVFTGLVQPADSMAYSDGFHLQRPRELDVDVQLAAALEAARRGLLAFELDGETIESLEEPVDLEGAERLVIHLRRPVVARRPGQES